MAKKTQGGFYAVKNGRKIGIWTDWTTCEMQVKGFTGARYKKFETKEDAEEYLKSTTEVEASTSTVPTGYYAVRIGHKPGIYPDWPSAKKQITDYPGAKHQKFPTRAAAEEWLREIPWLNPLSTTPPQASTPSSAAGQKRDISALEDDSVPDIVWTDGACKNNGKPNAVAGAGVWWGPGDPRNISERCPGVQTNNRGELLAILRVVETVPITKKPLEIRADSKYCIDCLETWLDGWKKRGFRNSKGEPVANKSLILCIDAHLQLRRKSGQKVDFVWVKGHAGITGNEGADRMANIGATLPEVPEPDWDAMKAEVLKKINDLEIASRPALPPPTSAATPVPAPAPAPALPAPIPETTTNVPATPSKVRKIHVETTPRPTPPRLAQPPIDLDDIPEPPESPRRSRSKNLPSASERYAEARRLALLIYPLLPEEMEEEQVEAIQTGYVDVSPTGARSSSPSPTKATNAKGKRAMSTKAGASSKLAARSPQPKPVQVAASSRAQPPSAPNGMAVEEAEEENLEEYAAALLDDDDLLGDLRMQS